MTEVLDPLRAVSSMATRGVLAHWLRLWQASGQGFVDLESVGGVDAARRVQAGEGFDLVFLAQDALQRLHHGGHVEAPRGLMVSPMAVAVPSGSAHPDIGTPEALQAALRQAPRVGYSTGPSGTALLALLDRWGLRETLAPRLRLSPAGVPVAQWVAQGEVDLGFQQLSELQGVHGVEVVDCLPDVLGLHTVFGVALACACVQPQRQRLGQALVDFVAQQSASAQALRPFGMWPL